MKNIFFYDHDVLAKTSVNVLHDTLNLSNEKFETLFDVKNTLLEKHKGSTVVSNSIEYFLIGLNENKIIEQSKEKKKEIEAELNKKNKELSILAAQKIKNNSEVFIHSLNNQIFEILSHASTYKKFKVNLLEHQPLEFGREFIKKLTSKNIEFRLFPDLAIEQAIFNSDVCFIGAEAILKNKGAITKSGTNLVSNIAKKNHCPVYVCAHSWNYDYKKTAIKLLDYNFGEKNPTNIFEHLPFEKIDSYITEHGIFKPEHAIEEITYFNKWMRL